MLKHELAMTLSDEELCFLIGLLGVEGVAGFDQEQLEQMTQSELEAAMVAAGRGLVARGFLSTTQDGLPALDPVVVSLVGTCAVPDVTFLVSVNTAASHEDRYYHVQREADVIVEHSFPLSGQHTFVNIPHRESLLERIGEFVELKSQVAPHRHETRILAENLSMARISAQEGAAGPDQIRDILKKGGLDEEMSTDLATAILDPIANNSLSRVDHHESRVAGFVTLEGHDGLWVLTPGIQDDDPWVKISRVSAADARALIADICGRE